MSKAKMQKMKTYTKMQTGKKVQKKDLPKVISKNLPDWIDSGLIAKTSNGWYMKTNNVDRATSAYKEHLAKNEQPVVEEAPAWVEAAEEAIAQPAEEISEGDAPASALSVFTLSLGNRAAAIIQMCDALASGQATLGVLQDIRGQGLMILGDLNLLQPVEDGPVEQPQD